MQNMGTSLVRVLARKTLQRYLSTTCVVRNNDFIIKSSFPDIVMPNTRFLDLLWKDSKVFQNHVALECAETKKTLTYQQLQRQMAVFATSLHKKLGLKTGDTVCVALPNCPEFAVVAFGSLQAGCVLTTMNPIYKEVEIAHQINLTEPKIIVTAPEFYESVRKGLSSTKVNARIVVLDTNNPIPDGAIRLSDISEKGEADYKLLDGIERKDDDTAVIPFSSGTTGLPKGVEITHGNLKAAFQILQGDNFRYPKLSSETHQDIVPCVLPFFHIYGMVITLIGHLTKGCKLVALPKFSVSTYLNVLKNQNVSLLYIVPPIAILLGKHPDVTSQHFKQVRHVLCGAAPLSASDAEGILKKSGKELAFGQGFGTTETTCIGFSTPLGSKVVDYSSAGVPMSNVELKFVDPLSGNPVKIGETGELYLRSPTVMKGYYKNEKETKSSITEDGFFKTGDLGHYKPGVGLYITDRIKELIKVKGLQVAPAELEGILRSHPSVADAAVIGVPHDFYGEVPKAFIIRKQGLDTSEEELKSFVADKVAEFKKIEDVMFVKEIPKTSSGKILRRELKRIYV